MAFTKRLLPLGFMMFSLFLGAGNLIFPPMLGQQAGDHLWIALMGFLLSAVGLPLLGVIAVAKMGGGLDAMSRDLPKWMALTMSIAVYLTIGALFANPRTVLVSYEFVVKPLIGSDTLDFWGIVYPIIFLGLSLGFALYPGKLINSMGKLIAPALVIVLAIIAVSVLLHPQDHIQAPQTLDMLNQPFITGFLRGYQTMDTLAALVFSMVVICALKHQNITAPDQLTRYTLQAAFFAGFGLCLVYWMLGYVGATSLKIAPNASNGTDIINLYMYHVLGATGQGLVAITIVLACLTTSIGLLSASGSFFATLLPWLGYQVCAILMALISFLFTQIGLEPLIQITIPTLMVCYPVTITLVMLCLLRNRISEPRYVFVCTLIPVFCVALIHVLGQENHRIFSAIDHALVSIPLEKEDLGWLLVGILCGLLSDMSYRVFIKVKERRNLMHDKTL